MQKIILANGTELTPVMVTGATKYIQGANRDSLTFVFDETYSMDSLDDIFTEEACETIKIVEDAKNEFLYSGYVIKTELTKKSEVVETATSETEEVSVVRVMVTMTQRTYSETKLAQVAQESTDTQMAVAELAELMMA